MAYETGSATDRTDLLNKLRIFLVADGWTQNAWAEETWTSPSTETGYRLHVNKGNLYVNFRTKDETAKRFWELYYSNSGTYPISGIGCNLSLGYSGETDPMKETGYIGKGGLGVGNSTGSFLPNITGAVISYHFLTYGTECAVVVEGSAGVFTHLTFGTFTGWNGGEYAWCSGPHGSHRLGGIWRPSFSASGDFPITYLISIDDEELWMVGGSDAYTNEQYAVSSLCYNYQTYAEQWNGLLGSLLCCPPSETGVVPLLPIYFATLDANFYKTPIGYLANMRILNFTGRLTGDIMTIGDETWFLFSNFEYTQNYGVNIPIGLAIRTS